MNEPLYWVMLIVIVGLIALTVIQGDSIEKYREMHERDTDSVYQLRKLIGGKK